VHYSTAEQLEEYLGDPLNPANVLSFKRAVELDEVEAYPEDASALLNRWGCNKFHVPVACGGKLASYEELYALVRTVSRRDMTVGITYLMTYIASCPAWVAGSPEQQSTLAELIESGNQVAIGLHEKAHGNDLLACEVEATEVANGYRLAGEKWVIGNPTRGKALIVFARTVNAGGPRGFSLFLLDKRNLPSSFYSYLPKFKTHGVRGHEIGGIRFHDCFVPDDALMGGLGAGLEIALKSSQITRTMVTATCLGAADTALRATLDFALARNLYGRTVFDIPHARGTLTDAFLDLLIGGCLATSATRSLHVVPDQMSVISAVIKYFVPTAIDELMRNVSVVLGARNYLREGHWWGIFQKLFRDTPITSVGHYSSVINLSHLAPQLQQLSRNKAATHDAERDARLAAIFSLNRDLPAFDANKLSLTNRGQNDVFSGLETAVARLKEIGDEGPALRETVELSEALLAEVATGNRALDELIAREGASFSTAPEAFEIARRYITLHAGAACLYLWSYNRNDLDEFFARGEWLALCLNRILTMIQPWRPSPPTEFVDNVTEQMKQLYEEDRLFSLIPMQLARTERVVRTAMTTGS
jgi:alkylation response protein AidB-like acyl-CoA dehydrogenase